MIYAAPVYDPPIDLLPPLMLIVCAALYVLVTTPGC
ncbi:MAG: hypothetical protein JWO31_722 [Phycisphaerales bacterium]|nr:hypothetical protein [Phycisphaerales bacterium]